MMGGQMEAGENEKSVTPLGNKIEEGHMSI